MTDDNPSFPGNSYQVSRRDGGSKFRIHGPVIRCIAARLHSPRHGGDRVLHIGSRLRNLRNRS